MSTLASSDVAAILGARFLQLWDQCFKPGISVDDASQLLALARLFHIRNSMHACGYTVGASSLLHLIATHLSCRVAAITF
jgi:hypothetical protein